MSVKRVTTHPAFWNYAWDVVDASPAAKTRTERKTVERLLLAIEEKAHPSDRWPDPTRPVSESHRLAIAEAVEAGKGHPYDPEARVSVDLTDDLLDRLKDVLETIVTKGAPAQGSHVQVSHHEARLADRLLDAIEAASPVIPSAEGK